MAGMGSSETRVRLCNITSPLVCTTFRLCLKRIQPNPPALVGIGAANRSAGSTRKQMSAQIPDSDWRTANLAGKAHATGVGYLKYVLIHKGRLKTMSSFAASPACLLTRLFTYASNVSSQIRQLSSVSAQTVRVSPFSMLWNDRLRAWSMRRVGPR